MAYKTIFIFIKKIIEILVLNEIKLDTEMEVWNQNFRSQPKTCRILLEKSMYLLICLIKTASQINNHSFIMSKVSLKDKYESFNYLIIN